MCVCMSGSCGADLEAEECGHAERGGLSPPHTHLGPPAGAGAAPLCVQRMVRTTSFPPFYKTKADSEDICKQGLQTHT